MAVTTVVTITLQVSLPVSTALNECVASGLFGISRADAAERILCEGLRRIITNERESIRRAMTPGQRFSV